MAKNLKLKTSKKKNLIKNKGKEKASRGPQKGGGHGQTLPKEGEEKSRPSPKRRRVPDVFNNFEKLKMHSAKKNKEHKQFSNISVLQSVERWERRRGGRGGRGGEGGWWWCWWCDSPGALQRVLD